MAKRIVDNTSKKQTISDILKAVNEDKELAALLKSKGISTEKLQVVKGMTNPEIIKKEFAGKGFFTRRQVMRLLGYDAWELAEDTEAYRTASKNIASPICGLRKELGSKWLDLFDKFAILSDEQLMALHSLVLEIGEVADESAE